MTERVTPPNGPFLASLTTAQAAVREAYFCHGCRQLRLGKPLESTTKCGSCGCTHLTVRAPGDPELYCLRFGKQLEP